MQNLTKQGEIGPTKPFSDRSKRYSWLNSSDPVRKRAPGRPPYTESSKRSGITCMSLIVLTILCVYLTVCTTAKADEVQLYLDISADWVIPLEPDQDLGANIEGGIRFPFDNGVSPYAAVGHHSFWLVGAPFNDDHEDSYEYIRIGVEFTW